MNFKKYRNQQGFSAKHEPKGFTLVELLVVVAVISILAGIFVPKILNYSESRQLQDVALDLQSNIRLAQTNAQTGVTCMEDIASDTWYLEFSGSGSYKMKTSCAVPTPGAGTPTPTPPFSHEYSFPSGISIDTIELDSCSGVDLKDSGVRVVFPSISGNLKYEVGGPDAGCGLSSDAKNLTIKLRSATQEGVTVSVVIGKGGSVYVKSE